MLGTPRRGERRAKKWRVSTQNGERASVRSALFSLSRPILCIASEKAFRRTRADDGAVVRAVSLESGNGERERGAFVPLCLCLPENERAKVSLIIVAAPRARREASCLEVLLQLRWSFVRLSTSRGGGRDTNNNVLKETGRSDRRGRGRRRQLFRVLREKQSLCGLGRIEAAHRGFQRRARGFHVGQTNRTGAGVRLKCETRRRCKQTGEEGGKNLLISRNRFT